MRKHPAAGMKAWWKSFRYKIVVIIMAVISSAAMMIPAYADVSSITFYGGSYTTTDPYEFEMVNMSGSTRPSAGYYVIEILADLEPNTIYNITFQANNADRLFSAVGTDLIGFVSDTKATSYMTSTTGQILSDISLQIYENGTIYYQYLISINTAGIELDNNPKYIYLHTNKITDNGFTDQVITRNIATFTGESESTQITNTITQQVTNIVNAIENINTQDIIDALQQIFEYGNSYSQIDSNLINNLGSAEDQLSNAEDALQIKSGSLQQSVSSQWNEATTKTRGFVSTVAPATAALTTTITQIVSAMPEEAQLLLTVIPMLLFIGWLIGRIGGG